MDWILVDLRNGAMVSSINIFKLRSIPFGFFVGTFLMCMAGNFYETTCPSFLGCLCEPFVVLCCVVFFVSFLFLSFSVSSSSERGVDPSVYVLNLNLLTTDTTNAMKESTAHRSDLVASVTPYLLSKEGIEAIDSVPDFIRNAQLSTVILVYY